MIRHLVFLRYANGISTDTKQGILDDLAKLQSEVAGALAFGSGPNISPEEIVVHGFKEMFWFDFRDAAARDAYLRNETHKGIAARINAAADSGTDGVFVCDLALP